VRFKRFLRIFLAVCALGLMASVIPFTPVAAAQGSLTVLSPASASGPASGLGLHVEFPDPVSSAAGLMSLAELQRLLGPGPLDI
jgi:hypothetical protein